MNVFSEKSADILKKYIKEGAIYKISIANKISTFETWEIDIDDVEKNDLESLSARAKSRFEKEVALWVLKSEDTSDMPVFIYSSQKIENGTFTFIEKEILFYREFAGYLMKIVDSRIEEWYEKKIKEFSLYVEKKCICDALSAYNGFCVDDVISTIRKVMLLDIKDTGNMIQTHHPTKMPYLEWGEERAAKLKQRLTLYEEELTALYKSAYQFWWSERDVEGICR